MTRILLVEDDDELRKLLKLMLTTSGYDVCEAHNGATGDKMFQQSRPDLVITDLIMPEKEGLEMIRELRQRNPSVRIVAISGGADCYLMIARKMGVQQTLSKPFGKDQFLKAVRLALEDGRTTKPRATPGYGKALARRVILGDGYCATL